MAKDGRKTIKDVAAAAGVSIGTASRALNRRGRVSDATVIRVTNAAKKLGYQPDAIAQSLRLKSTMVVGMLVTDLSNPFFAGVIRAAERRLQQAGYALLVASPNTYDPVGIGDSQEMLVRLIGAAKRDIVIEVMDYSTTAFGGGAYHVIDDAIRAAAKRGVHVRLIIADWALTDQRLPGLTSLAAVPNVDIRVASIPQPDSGPIPYARVVHTKVMTIDNATAWIGTSNWEGGYLDTSRNVEVVLNDAAMANRLRALEDRLWNSDYAAPFAVARTRPPVHPGG